MPIGDDKFTELPKSVNELIADRAIRHALYLERYKTQLVQDLLKEFNGKLEPALTAKIERSLRDVTGTSKQLQTLFKKNGDLVREEYKVMESKLYEQLRDLSKVESSWLIQTMQHTLPIAFDFVAPNANMLKALVTHQPMEGALVSEWFKELGKKTSFAVNRSIQMGMIEGEGIEAIVRRIKGTRANNYTDGILNASRSNLRSVVRTSVSHVSHTAREEVYKENTDVIKGVQIQATLDTRTCMECMNLDGKVFPIDEGRRPPFHYSCRCTDTPVLKTWKELGIPLKELPPGTRASSALTKAEKERIKNLPKAERDEILSKLQGQVPATITYPAWLKNQTVDVQNEALGVERAKLFRSGQFKLKEFLNRQDKPITLKALASK